MKSGLILGIVCAIALHAGVLLFGGMIFHVPGAGPAKATQVELLSEKDSEEKKKPDEPEKTDVQTKNEKPPDSAEVIHNLEQQPIVNSAPALDAASLSAIEAALSGGLGGGGDFASGMDFSSGGRIGGTGKAGGGQAIDNAFSTAEIDQKPRAIFQAVPVYPSKLRNVEGVVTMIFIVDESGRVTNARVEKSSNPEFEKPALDAIRQWKFEPAIKAGKRVSCKMRVPIRFQPK